MTSELEVKARLHFYEIYSQGVNHLAGLDYRQLEAYLGELDLDTSLLFSEVFPEVLEGFQRLTEIEIGELFILLAPWLPIYETLGKYLKMSGYDD